MEEGSCLCHASWAQPGEPHEGALGGPFLHLRGSPVSQPKAPGKDIWGIRSVGVQGHRGGKDDEAQSIAERRGLMETGKVPLAASAQEVSDGPGICILTHVPRDSDPSA